jgi:hypothetical protein
MAWHAYSVKMSKLNLIGPGFMFVIDRCSIYTGYAYYQRKSEYQILTFI